MACILIRKACKHILSLLKCELLGFLEFFCVFKHSQSCHSLFVAQPAPPGAKWCQLMHAFTWILWSQNVNKDLPHDRQLCSVNPFSAPPSAANAAFCAKVCPALDVACVGMALKPSNSFHITSNESGNWKFLWCAVLLCEMWQACIGVLPLGKWWATFTCNTPQCFNDDCKIKK